MGTLSYTTTEIDDKLTGAYGGIHTHENVTAQSIPTGATYTKVVNWMDNDPSANATPDASNGQITALKDGDYRIEGSFSFQSGTANVVSFGSVFIDGVEQEGIHFTRKVSTAGDVGNAGVTGLVSLTSGQVVDFRLRHDNGGSINFTFSYMNLNLARVDI